MASEWRPLTAGFKALALWFPKQRLALANGCMIMLGALGAVAATAPAEWSLGLIGWRGLFELLAIICAGCALIIFFVVPGGESRSRRADHVCSNDRFESNLDGCSILALGTAFGNMRRDLLGSYRDCGPRPGWPMWTD